MFFFCLKAVVVLAMGRGQGRARGRGQAKRHESSQPERAETKRRRSRKQPEEPIDQVGGEALPPHVGGAPLPPPSPDTPPELLQTQTDLNSFLRQSQEKVAKCYIFKYDIYIYIYFFFKLYYYIFDTL